MIGERCGTCEFYAYHTENFDCCVPQWMPLKNLMNINERVPEDCPIRNKSREEWRKEIKKMILKNTE